MQSSVRIINHDLTLFFFFFCYLQAPVGRIFFTGEHTSERFNGYVHGGYLAGEDRGYLTDWRI